MTLAIEYDKEANAAYIHINNKPCAFTKPLDDMRYINYASDNTVVGIELLCVNDGVNLDDLPEQVKIAKLLEKENIKAFA